MAAPVTKYAILHGDVLDRLRDLPDGSVHTIVTSPPWWNLRDYGVAGQIGQESTIEEHVEKMVLVFREVRRVLRDDGVVWMHYGDKYDRKSLVLQPHRVAIGLLNDGWLIAQDVVWEKNAIPAHGTIRPTRCHDYLFMMAKEPGYYYDNLNYRDKVTGNAHSHSHALHPKGQMAVAAGTQGTFSVNTKAVGSDRSPKSVWYIGTEGFKEAHFATFSVSLVRKAIALTTSAIGVCPVCAAPWRRVLDRTFYGDWTPKSIDKASLVNRSVRGAKDFSTYLAPRTVAWEMGCACHYRKPVPATVLDPFSGAASTGVAALELGRQYLGVELNPEYVKMSLKRLRDTEIRLAAPRKPKKERKPPVRGQQILFKD